MAENKITLTKSDRLKVWFRHQYLQGSWNYERMQNGGWCFSMIPAIKKLYTNKDDQIAALKRHMEFYNTHPYVSSPVIGVTLALEEDRANGAPVEDAAIQGVKVGMMGPLAGVGDPVFWFTLRPLLGALGAGLAMSGNIMGPILFFVAWNVIRLAFEWYTQEFGYKLGTSITKDLGGGLMGKITEGASILGMFVIGGLVQRLYVYLLLRRSPRSRSLMVRSSTGLLLPTPPTMVVRALPTPSTARFRSTLRLAPPALSRSRSPRSSRTSTSSFLASPLCA